MTKTDLPANITANDEAGANPPVGVPELGINTPRCKRKVLYERGRANGAWIDADESAFETPKQ